MINLEMKNQQDETIESIVHRAQTGDQSAFMELVGRYSGMSYAAAYAILRNKEDAEDAKKKLEEVGASVEIK